MSPITTAELRKHLGEIFNRVAYAGETYIVERKGKEIGAIVPPRILKAMQAQRSNAHEKLLKFLSQRSAMNQNLSEEQAMDIALEAQAEVRGHTGSSPKK